MRGKGYVRRLLVLAHERNRSAGYDVAMLFTRSPWVYSGSAGFSVLPCSWLDLDVHRVPLPAGQWTIKPVDPNRHLTAIRHVYERFGQGRLGYPQRGDAYWAHPARLNDASWMRVALDRDEHVAAYLCVHLAPDGRAILQEFPYLVGDAAFALAADLGRDPVIEQCAGVGGRLPRDHVLGLRRRVVDARQHDVPSVHGCRQPVTCGAARPHQSAQRVLVWRRLLSGVGGDRYRGVAGEVVASAPRTLSDRAPTMVRCRPRDQSTNANASSRIISSLTLAA